MVAERAQQPPANNADTDSLRREYMPTSANGLTPSHSGSKMRMLMRTPSLRQWQRDDALPTSTHAGVAKFTASAQLRPVLKPLQEGGRGGGVR